MDLTRVLRGHAPGEWVVLSADLKKVLASAPTPEEAMTKAKQLPTGSRKKKPVLMQVPDPSMVWLF